LQRGNLGPIPLEPRCSQDLAVVEEEEEEGEGRGERREERGEKRE